MKTHRFSTLSCFVVLLVISLVFNQNLTAQDSSGELYFEITKIKKSNDDLMDVEDELIRPFVQQRIKHDNQLFHAMFKVVYPYSKDADYDYVILDIFSSFEHLNMGEKKMVEMANAAFPYAKNLQSIIDRFEAASKNMGSDVFIVKAEAIPGPKGGSEEKPRFVQVNHMKVSEADASEYVKMEKEIFMPLHKNSIESGKMYDWILVQRIMPYGSEWDDSYLTFDIFNNWKDISQLHMSNNFSEVHPNKKQEDVWGKISKLRDLRRTETWEVVSVVDAPPSEVSIETVKEGTGDSPMMGKEVVFQGKMMDQDGEVLFSSEELGFDFYHIIGSDPYHPQFDKALLSMKKGGMATLTIPPDVQDRETRQKLDGKNAIYKVELVDFADAKPNGAEKLKKKIHEHGLEAAKATYEKLKAHNPEGYVFREGAMNQLGYQLLKEGKTEEAIYIFDLNTKLYPKSYNACDSLADGYKADGNHAKAKHCYEMALKINPNFKASKEKLAKL